ncbi:MAG: serine hydrolase [Gemmatimonadota bacterium]|nr:MAG: serine hydrolase [Gemmatimonadota bacterium]
MQSLILAILYQVQSRTAHAVLVAALAAAAMACSGDPVSSEQDPDALEYVTPEEVGFSSAALQQAVAGFEQIGSAAVVALYDGKVFLSCGEVDRKFWCHSIRKSFLSSLYGIYVGRGVIDTSKTLEELGIDDIAPSLTVEERQARVADLLRSRSGVYHEAAAETADMAAQRPERGSHPPGTFFYYNNWDFNVAGAIFEQETGVGIFDAFESEIAGPIGMEDFVAADGSYSYEPEKSIHPAYPFKMTAMDMARFGLLYLRNGNWNGQQIVPHDWITVSTTAYSIAEADLNIWYGMMWYVIPEDFPVLGPGFFHTGIGVHLLLVLPQDNLVIVHRVNTFEPWTLTAEDYFPLIAQIVDARIN